MGEVTATAIKQEVVEVSVVKEEEQTREEVEGGGEEVEGGEERNITSEEGGKQKSKKKKKKKELQAEPEVSSSLLVSIYWPINPYITGRGCQETTQEKAQKILGD